MKRFFFTVISVVVSSTAIAAVQISPGNELVPDCNLPSRGVDFREVGDISQANGRSVLKEVTTAGKEVKLGESVYYVKLGSSKTYYLSSKQAEIKDKSPLTPDSVIHANQKYEVAVNYTLKNSGEKFVLLNINSPVGLAIAKSNGVLCSAIVLSDERGIRRGGLPDAYQDPNVPLQRIEEETGDGNVYAVAISLKDSDAVSATFDVAVLSNGRVENRKTVAFDKMDGEARVGELLIAFEAGKAGDSIRVKSINAPSSWSSWLNTVFRQRF